MAKTIKLRRDTAANWALINPVLSAGEPGLDTDALKVKYGNGVSAWNDLPYGTGAEIAGSVENDETDKSPSVAAVAAALATKQDTSAKGTANGYAPLGADGKVPAANLPDSTASAKGVIQIATDAEVTTGTDTSKATNSKQVTNRMATRLPLAGGTMTGVLVAQSNTSYTTAQVRNITAGTADLTAGSYTLASGQIYLVYTSS